MGFTMEDIKSMEYKILYKAIKKGHIDIINYLLSTWISSDNLLSSLTNDKNISCLRKAIINHPEIIKNIQLYVHRNIHKIETIQNDNQGVDGNIHKIKSIQNDKQRVNM